MTSEFAPAARRALAVVRLVNGALGLLAPRFLLRRLGAGPSDTTGVYPFRMFGIRTIVMGAELLLPEGEQRRQATRLAVLVHGTDTLSALTAGLRGDLPRRAAVVTTAISAGNTVLAVVALQE
jgi:hypothetical protein